MNGGLLDLILRSPEPPEPAPYNPVAESVQRAMETIWRELVKSQPDGVDWTAPMLIYTSRTRRSRMWRGRRFVYHTGLGMALKHLSREDTHLR